MNDKSSDQQLAQQPTKPKSGQVRIAFIVLGVMVLLCCGISILTVWLIPSAREETSVAATEEQSSRGEAAAISEELPTEAAPTTDRSLLATEEPTVAPSSTPEPTDTLQPTGTSEPTNTVRPTNTPQPTNTAAPTNTAQPTGTSEPTNTPASTNTPEPTSTPIPTAIPSTSLIRPGTHLVGTDILPGIYRGSAGTGILDSCYWARLSGLTGDLDAVLANDNSIGQFYVEVRESDVALETACQLVALDSLPASTGVFPTTLAPGMYIVGRDIAPGTYRGEAGADILESCYWARLSNLSGDLYSILANDNSNGQFFVQVSQSDFALETACELQLVQ